MTKLNKNLKTLINEIKVKLVKKKYTIASAESCTGGLLSAYLTSTEGSSLYFNIGAVTYSNDAKVKLLKVPREIIARYGAVSEETAEYMARGVGGMSNADIAISITGVAGPGGGSPEKPVGTICFGLYAKKKVETFTRYFSGNREKIRERACKEALEKIYVVLNETD